MQVNPRIEKEMNHSTSELKFSEASFVKKYEELLKTVENHAKQLDEVKTKLVKFLSCIS
jgi:hypothetical protein